MITALATPASNKFFLDANNTLIRIQSTNGEGYYFRAKIYVNDVLFDEQGWSRSDAYTAEKDIKRLCEAYFVPAFSGSFLAGLTEQTHLVKKVKIIIEEYSLDDAALVSSLELPVFSVMYNILPETFSDVTKVRILGIEPEILVVPANGKISVPFYINAASEFISATLETDLGTALDSQVTPATYTGKKVFMYRYNLAATSINSTVTYLKLTLRCGGSSSTKLYRVNHLPVYSFKEIAFRNNFGYYLYAYFAGELEAQKSFDADIYETADGTQRVSAINQETTYTINSGNFNAKEKAIISMIAASTDPKINLEVNTISNAVKNVANWKDMLPKTKKHTYLKDKQHTYSDDLIFSIRSGSDVSNTGMITVVPAQPDIVVTGVAVTGHDVKVSFIVNNGFNPANLRLQFRPVNTTNWATLAIVAVSPISFRTASGSYIVRLIDWNDQTNVSNASPFTIL